MGYFDYNSFEQPTTGYKILNNRSGSADFKSYK